MHRFSWHRIAATAAVLAAASIVDVAADTNPIPQPGQYRVDSDTVQPMGMPGMEVRLHIDGATGLQTQTVLEPGKKPVVTTRPGEGPVLGCVPSSPTGRIVAPAGACLTNMTPTRPTDSTTCPGLAVSEEWKRINATTWEHRQDLAFDLVPPPGAGNAAIEMAMRGMTPAERERAKKELAATMPTDAQRASAMDEMKAKMEAAAHGSNPEEAALAREMLARMSAPGGGTGQRVTRVERWTLTGAKCDKR